MAHRQVGRGPYVRDEGGGRQPRSRTKRGTWPGSAGMLESDADAAEALARERNGHGDHR